MHRYEYRNSKEIFYQCYSTEQTYYRGKYVYHKVYVASVISAVKCADALTNTIILIEKASFVTYTYNKWCWPETIPYLCRRISSTIPKDIL